jgi:hypothetical protein
MLDEGHDPAGATCCVKAAFPQTSGLSDGQRFGHTVRLACAGRCRSGLLGGIKSATPLGPNERTQGR